MRRISKPLISLSFLAAGSSALVASSRIRDKKLSFAEDKSKPTAFPVSTTAGNQRLLTSFGVVGVFAVFSVADGASEQQQGDSDWYNWLQSSKGKIVKSNKEKDLDAMRSILSRYSDRIQADFYLTRGLTQETDFMIRIHSEDLSTIQDFLTDFKRETKIGSISSNSKTFIGVTQPLQYITKDKSANLNKELFATVYNRGQPLNAVVVPVEKTAAWWNLKEEEKLKMIEVHTRATLPYLENVKRKLYHSTGLTDADFVTYFETNEIESFHTLMRQLAKIPENTYHTKRGYPIVVATRRSLDEIIDKLL